MVFIIEDEDEELALGKLKTKQKPPLQ